MSHHLASLSTSLMSTALLLGLTSITVTVGVNINVERRQVDRFWCLNIEMFNTVLLYVHTLSCCNQHCGHTQYEPLPLWLKKQQFPTAFVCHRTQFFGPRVESLTGYQPEDFTQSETAHLWPTQAMANPGNTAQLPEVPRLHCPANNGKHGSIILCCFADEERNRWIRSWEMKC